jgi:hypothetical protein
MRSIGRTLATIERAEHRPSEVEKTFRRAMPHRLPCREPNHLAATPCLREEVTFVDFSEVKVNGSDDVFAG